MRPTDLIIDVIDGRVPERVPTFCADLDEWPVQQVLGKPLIPPKAIFLNPVSRFILDQWGKKLKKVVVDPFVCSGMMNHVKAALQLDFDSTWVSYEWRIMMWNSKTIARVTGYISDLIDDGHGNISWMYKEPLLTSPQAFEEWPYFPDPDEVAQNCYGFFKKIIGKFGDRICIMGNACIGLHDAVFQSIGFEKAILYLRKDQDFIRRFIAFHEEYLMKTAVAMLDAGIEVILHADDFSQKTGPIMNPKMIDEFFGGAYTRLTKLVHDRGKKILLHSYGDNTRLFDLFIKWGFDGGHAFENTSNVDISYEKKAHGDRFTIIGGVGIDYLLTERSKPEEVIEAVKKLIKTCAPGGRFIIGPVHAHSQMDVSKIRVMIETVKEYGKYPINI